jgi:arginine deiminase
MPELGTSGSVGAPGSNPRGHPTDSLGALSWRARPRRLYSAIMNDQPSTQSPPLSIRSEVGRLRAVVTHLPGREVELMVPAMMEELLFDDILFAERAREEHRRLQRILGLVADEVLTFERLLVECLADGDARAAIEADVFDRLDPAPAVRELLGAKDAEGLAHALIEGTLRPGVAQVPRRAADLYDLPPTPNLMFMRDPAVVIGEQVTLSSMATRARLREPLLLRAVLEHHPRFTGCAKAVLDRFEPDFGGRSTARPRPSIEGGDIIVARDDLLLIGASIRTTRQTIESLARALQQAQSPIRTILIVELPQTRSYMHLDTVFTIVSEHQCLVYEPVILDGGVEQAAVYQLHLDHDDLHFHSAGALLPTLASLGLELEPIICGGAGDPVAQQREQWTDGANAFAMAPGVILLYERNIRTAEVLDRAGYRLVNESDLLLGRDELDIDSGKPAAILLRDYELSRARGGPRCLTMPLVRDSL